eukprot:COSAG06_NODE_1963_length_7972_cov_10.409628_3_plen_305_part_00
MRAYPFDTQTIPVTVWHKNDWELKPCICTTPDGGSYTSTFDHKKVERNLEAFTCPDKRPEEDSPDYIPPGEPGYSPHLDMPVAYRKAEGRVRPALTIGLRVQRKTIGFWAVYIVPFGIIGALSGLALALPTEELSNRSNIMGLHSVALVALMVAHKDSSIAGIQTLTLIDKYFVCILVFISVGMTESAIVYERGISNDSAFAAGWYISYVLMHVVLWGFHRNYMRYKEELAGNEGAGGRCGGFPWMRCSSSSGSSGGDGDDLELELEPGLEPEPEPRKQKRSKRPRRDDSSRRHDDYGELPRNP